ncbi:MAG: uroporphyrinogen-III C-methyltransferase [bacterium]
MASANTGTVYLIGAGPGDPDLITVRGRRLLNDCRAVVYDNLVPFELIVTLPATTEKHYVGKQAGKSCRSQEEINRLLVRLASEGKNVARLKGSDPLIFGRGAEEAQYLKKNGIRFEIVPGVTSGIAAPVYAGIPCTDRDRASFVLFVTGHKAADKAVSDVPWEWVAKANHGTVVIYMGVGEISDIVTSLVEKGMPAETAAAVIERGTFPSQRVFTTTLAELPRTVTTQDVRSPALFVLGKVVELRPIMQWFEARPLLGVRVMVTRPADQAQPMYDSLRQLGAEVSACPTIATAEHIDDNGWQAFEKLSSENRWLVFTSENGVRYFMRQFFSQWPDVRRLGCFRIAALGHGTAGALARYNLKADFVPTEATTAAFAQQLAGSRSWENSEVVRVRGNLSVDNIDRSLAAAGAGVLPLTVYRTFHPTWPEGLTEKLLQYPPDVITFTSGTSVTGLFEILPADNVKSILSGAKVLTIGPATSAVAREHGLDVTIEARRHSIPAMIDELVAYATEHSLRRSS